MATYDPYEYFGALRAHFKKKWAPIALQKKKMEEEGRKARIKELK